MAELYITKELLEGKGACQEGVQYFESVFPEGCGLTDENINKIKNCKADFIWWFIGNICPDKRLYLLCGVSESNGISGSNGISNSFGILNCRGVTNALFLADLPEKYTLFGQEVSLEKFQTISQGLNICLKEWRPKYCNVSGSILSNKEAWADMPQKAIDYVRSWPEFDSVMFERITGIGTDRL